MRTILIAITLVLTGCGEDDRIPDFVTNRGVAFHMNGVDKVAKIVLNEEQANEIEDFTWSIWSTVRGATKEQKAKFDSCLGNAWVEFHTKEDMECMLFDKIFNPSKVCGGNYGGGAIDLGADTAHGCSYGIPYSHELLHLLMWCDGGKVDPMHNDNLWRVFDLNETDWMNSKSKKCNDQGG